MSETRYKFLNTENGLKSEYGNHSWRIGEWYEVTGDVRLCRNGFHCSERVGRAFSFVKGGAVARVEVDGASTVSAEGDKEVWQRMRLVDVRQWRKEDSVSLAIFRSVFGAGAFRAPVSEGPPPARGYRSGAGLSDQPV